MVVICHTLCCVPYVHYLIYSLHQYCEIKIRVNLSNVIELVNGGGKMWAAFYLT